MQPRPDGGKACDGATQVSEHEYEEEEARIFLDGGSSALVIGF